MTHTRLEQQIRFIVELEKLKRVERQNFVIDRSRPENSAEHSWHIAVMASILAEHADHPIDKLKVTRMLLVHDVVEIDAGDTYCYDPAANADKSTREQQAAARLFSLLPDDQRDQFRALWEEFEANQTPDAQFANALDRLQPLLNHYHTQEQSWRACDITVDQVTHRMSPIPAASASLGHYVHSLIADAFTRGYLAPVGTMQRGSGLTHST